MLVMILKFKNQQSEDIFNGLKSKSARRLLPVNLFAMAQRKLDLLENAIDIIDLRVPPNNKLEKLSGDRIGQHSIRINDQYRICFFWTDHGVDEVEIVDYH